MGIQSYRDLTVWRKSMDLVVTSYRLVESFPKFENYGLGNQLRRAAVSVPANIAEGNGRRSSRTYLHHLSISYGSLMELETHLMIAGELGYISEPEIKEVLERTAEIGRMLNALIERLEVRINTDP